MYVLVDANLTTSQATAKAGMCADDRVVLFYVNLYYPIVPGIRTDAYRLSYVHDTFHWLF